MIFWAFFVRFVTRHPVRFAATVLGTAIGVGSVIAIVLSCQAAVRAMEEDVEIIAGRTQIEITAPGGIPASLLGELRGLAQQASITPVVDDLVFVPQLNDMARVLGIDFLNDRLFRDLEWDGNEDIQSETLMELLRGEGMLIAEPLREQLKLELQDEVEILSKAKEYLIPVKAVFQPARFSSSWDRVLVMDIAKAQSLLGKNNVVDRLELIPKTGVDPQALRAELQRSLPDHYLVAAPSDRSEETGRMIRSLRFNLTALSGISLLVGAVLVAITLYTSVIQRKYTIALLQSLGATRRQIALGVLMEAAAIGLCGGLAGVGLGIFGAWMALSSVRATIAAVVQGVPVSDIQFQIPWLIWGILLGLAVSMLSSYWALREALRTPPLQSLKSENPQAVPLQRRFLQLLAGCACLFAAFIAVYFPPLYGLPVPALVSALLVLLSFVVVSPFAVDVMTQVIHACAVRVRAVPLSLAAGSLAAARERTALAASAICLSVALAVSMTIMITSFRQTIVEWTRQATLSDLWIRPLKTSSGVPAGNLNSALVELAFELFGEENVDPFYRETAYIDGEKITLGAGAFFPVRAVRGGVPFMDGRKSADVFRSAYENGRVIVNESFMRRFGYQKGDTPAIQVQNETIQRTIEGVFYDYSSHRGTVIMDRQDFLRYYTHADPQGIGVFLSDHESAQTARERLRQVLAPEYAVDILLNRELRQEIMRVFERTFAITYSLQWISAIVAGIAVLTVLFALVGERKRDLALLQAIGASRLQVMFMIVSKALMMGITGLLGGMAAGMLVGIILVEVVNLQSFHWTLRFTIPWIELGWMSGLVLLACGGAACAPAWSVTQQQIHEVLRSDE